MNQSNLLASIIINNYNYGRFLDEAIRSALNQTYLHTEVIVVDDGSSDESRDIIANYQEQIIPIFKENGGQASALNAGFKHSKGEVLFFLDSDDVFFKNKVEETLPFIKNKMIDAPKVMVYHLLEVINKFGVSYNFYEPRWIALNLESEVYNTPNLYQYACKYRYIPFAASATSGNLLTRKLAEQIFPLPEQEFQISADDLIVRTACLIGEVYRIDKILGQYRLHGNNNWYLDPNHQIDPEQREFSDQRKQALKLESDFLNQKLKENHKKPVISYFDSMLSFKHYEREGSNLKMLLLAIRVINWHLDQKTWRFFRKVTSKVIKNYLFKIQAFSIKFGKGNFYKKQKY